MHFLQLTKSKKPILMCHKSSVGVVRLKGLSMESGRRINYQSDQIVATMAEGIGGLRPEATFMGIIDDGDPAMASLMAERDARIAEATAQLQAAKEASVSVAVPASISETTTEETKATKATTSKTKSTAK